LVGGGGEKRKKKNWGFVRGGRLWGGTLLQKCLGGPCATRGKTKRVRHGKKRPQNVIKSLGVPLRKKFVRGGREIVLKNTGQTRPDFLGEKGPKPYLYDQGKRKRGRQLCSVWQ